MSQFSTGELAKAAEVSVRTVQYYDQRGILTPSEVTEGVGESITNQTGTPASHLFLKRFGFLNQTNPKTLARGE